MPGDLAVQSDGGADLAATGTDLASRADGDTARDGGADLGGVDLRSGADLASAGDLASAADLLGADLQPSNDLAATGDLAQPGDLAATGDLAQPGDLAATGDLAQPGDLAVPLPANGGDTCASAPELPIGVTVMGQTTEGLADNYNTYSTGCINSFLSDGADTAYFVNVPGGKTLSVTVTPLASSDFDPVLGIVSTCSANLTCLASADKGAARVAETVTYANAGTQAKLVYIIVDSYVGFASPGKYTIRGTLVP
jgi:hypothetical protein